MFPNIFASLIAFEDQVPVSKYIFEKDEGLHEAFIKNYAATAGLACANDFFFVVNQLNTNFLKPASLGDNLRIETFFLENSFCSIKLRQIIFVREMLITEIDVKLVWINGNTKKPSKIPENIIARFNSLEVV